MAYADAECIDKSDTGIAIRTQERIRFSALVHMELPECRLTALGRVASCVESGETFRLGFELLDTFHAMSPTQ